MAEKYNKEDTGFCPECGEEVKWSDDTDPDWSDDRCPACGFPFWDDYYLSYIMGMWEEDV